MLCDWRLSLAHSANAAVSTPEVVRSGLDLHRAQIYRFLVNCQQNEI